MNYRKARREAQHHAKIVGNPTVVANVASEGGFVWVEHRFAYIMGANNENIITRFDENGKEDRT